MRLHRLRGAPEPRLARALAEFEGGFSYPLGPGRSFRIEHGPDYTRFYRSLGPALCSVAEKGGRVAGVLCGARRRLLAPSGRVEDCSYAGDLKIAPEARGGFALLRLGRAVMAWLQIGARPCYSVVMDGTGVLPPAYTGRAGLPAFEKAGRVVFWRLKAPRRPRSAGTQPSAGVRDGEACFRRLIAGCFVPVGGDPRLRSSIPPEWLVLSDGSACGRLEDTRRAKRLIARGGEIVSAHLARFTYAAPASGARLLRGALARAAELGFPALFVPVEPRKAPALAEALGNPDRTEAAATIYANGLNSGSSWNISSSEV